MAASGAPASGEPDRVRITLPAGDEFIRVVRMIVGGAGSMVGLGEEETADLKVAISEACTSAVASLRGSDGHPRGTIDVCLDLRNGVVEVEVCETGGGGARRVVHPTEPEEAGHGLTLIECLMDSVEVVDDEASGTHLRFCKRTAPISGRR